MEDVMTLPEFEGGNRDLGRLCLHTITTKSWDIFTALSKYAEVGIGGISIWRDALAGHHLSDVHGAIVRSGLHPVSLVRGGFFTSPSDSARKDAVDENKRAIDEAEALGCPMVVMVCGASPGQSLSCDLNQIQDGLAKTLDHAEAAGVKLTIEPLHPMYADTRSAVATLKMANDLCDVLDSSSVGVAVDAFHVWWDPEFDVEIERCGKAGNISAYHICDWKRDMDDMLNDRGLMGEGIIDLNSMSRKVDDCGFSGFYEVEIFSRYWWAQDQDEYLRKIVKAYQNSCPSPLVSAS